MKKILLPLLLPILLYSCSSTKKRNDILTTGNLESQFFYVDPERDTVLKTSHAAIVRIQKGTFSVKGKVSIELKEAYRPDEIMLAGLGTTADGKPLRSAGMLYFNATAEGKQVEPSLPVAAIIPAASEDTAMKLFKGEEQADGSIDWVDPQPVDTAMPEAQRKLFESGKLLFHGKCGSCHRIFKPATGPALRNVQLRGPWKNPKNLLAWINNPARFMALSSYAQEIKKQYGGQLMTAFTDLKMPDVQALLTYINHVSEEPPYQVPKPVADTETMQDTLYQPDCGYDTTYTSVQNSYEEYDTTGSPQLISLYEGPEDSTQAVMEVYDPNSKAGYAITITANGWYNVDAFLKEEDSNTTKVKLNAVLNQPAEFYMDVYVVVPSEKVMQPSSGYKGNNYRFIFWNGTIPLPLRHRALIFAVGSYKDKIYYGVKEFTIENEQTISVDIKETTKDGLKDLIYSRQMDGVEIDAVERKIQLRAKPCNDGPEINAADTQPNNPGPVKKDTAKAK